MDGIKLWARNGEAVRQAIELGEIVHMETASEELTDEFLLFAMESGLLTKWADGFPDPRQQCEIAPKVILASSVAARFAGMYSMRKTGYALRSARVLGALGYSVEVVTPGQGLSDRGTGNETLYSGDVIRKLLVKMERQVEVKTLGLPVKMATDSSTAGEGVGPVKGRGRRSRRAVKQAVDAPEAELRGRTVVQQLVDWYNSCVGPSLLRYADLGPGRRIHILDATRIEVDLATDTYECSGVVENDDGTFSRGYKLGTLRTLLDTAGLLTQVAVSGIAVHDLKLCRPLLESRRVLRAGDLLIEDRGFLDGGMLSYLKSQRQVDVIVPLKANMLAYKEAVQLAQIANTWEPHPSRPDQQIAFVQALPKVWDECTVTLNACVIRFFHKKKKQMDYIVLVTTDLALNARWIVVHYEERPEIEQDYEQMKSGGWLLQKLSSTRYSEIAFYILTVVLSYSLYHLFANTQAGAKFAHKTRQAIALEQFCTQRTHIIVYAGNHFEIFETFTFMNWVLQRPAPVQAHVRAWLQAHLGTVEKRE